MSWLRKLLGVSRLQRLEKEDICSRLQQAKKYVTKFRERD